VNPQIDTSSTEVPRTEEIRLEKYSISRLYGTPIQSGDSRLLPWKQVWNFGDSSTNFFESYGDSRDICWNFGSRNCFRSNLLRLWSTVTPTWNREWLSYCERRDRGIYSIWGGRSLYCLHFGVSQLMGPEACFGIFVRVLVGWLSNRSLYQTFPVKSPLLYQAVGTQANDEKSVQFHLSIWKIFWQRLLASPRLGTKGAILLEMSGTSFGCLVNRPVLVQISQNMLRVPQVD